MTGAPVPEGADAIVMVEVTRADGDDVEILEPARPGDHVRPGGRRPASRSVGVQHGHGAHARARRRARQPRHRRSVVRAAAARRRRVHRRRARRTRTVAARPHPRLEPADAAGIGRRIGVRAGRLRHRARRRARDRRTHRHCSGRVRRAGHERCGVDGRLRLREGRARAARTRPGGERLLVDAGRDQARQAARVRHARPERRSSSAGVRAARQPGVVPRELRALRPTRAAEAGRPHARCTTRSSRPSPPPRSSAAPTASSISIGCA